MAKKSIQKSQFSLLGDPGLVRPFFPVMNCPVDIGSTFPSVFSAYQGGSKSSKIVPRESKGVKLFLLE